MGKYISKAHITGDRGVIKFKEYCNKHNPFIIFREIKEHDYGIDGEIETVRYVEDKMVASGNVLKVQLKSTASVNSYIKNETDTEFTYYASHEDYQYWAEHNLAVLLIVYNCITDQLFVRKITPEDYAFHRKHTKNRSYPIEFTKLRTELFVGESDFFKKINHDYFKPRFDSTVNEKLISNIQFFSSYPKIMYVFNTSYRNKKEIFSVLGTYGRIAVFAFTRIVV